LNKLLISRILFLAVSVLAFTACKTSKTLVNKPTVEAPFVKPLATDASPFAEVFKMLSENAFKFQWLNARLEATVEIDKEVHNVNAQIRMRKDSVMWISVTAMGFEVARALVTKDTLKMVDRFHSRYGIKDYGYLNEILNIALDFPMIQAVLTGNYVPYIDVQKLKSAKDEKDHYELSTLSRRKSRKAGIEWEPVKVQLQITKLDNHITRMYIDDKEAKKEVDITYDDFRLVNGASFPYKITFKTERKSPVKIEIQYSKVNADMPQEFPFTIPRSFERIK
jgi:hypothetical protein